MTLGVTPSETALEPERPLIDVEPTDEGGVRLSLRGRMTNAEVIALFERLTDPEVQQRDVTVDCRDCAYLGGAPLQCLVMVSRALSKVGRVLRLCGANDDLVRAAVTLGVADYLSWERTNG